MFRIGRARGIKERQAGLRAARRSSQRVANDTIRGIIDRRIVPTANATSPSIVRGSMKGGSARLGGYLTTNARGRKRAIVFILNFGATLSKPIVPKARKRGRSRAALSFQAGGGQVVVAKVTGPRKIAGKHWMEAAVHAHRGGVRIAIAREVPRAVQAHIDRGG